jgi:hypothetical protein
LNAAAAAIQHMRVDHCRTDIAMPQQLLYGPDIVPVFEQMVANEWRSEWHVAGFGIPELRTASRTAFCSTDSWR